MSHRGNDAGVADIDVTDTDVTDTDVTDTDVSDTSVTAANVTGTNERVTPLESQAHVARGVRGGVLKRDQGGRYA